MIVWMELIEADELPSFDQVEAAGFDGTLRDRLGTPITWKMLAERLIANQVSAVSILQGKGLV